MQLADREGSIMSRRLRIVATGPIVGTPRHNWQVLDAQTGEAIAGVHTVQIRGGLCDVARITLELNGHEVDVDFNWGENSCSSPTDES